MTSEVRDWSERGEAALNALREALRSPDVNERLAAARVVLDLNLSGCFDDLPELPAEDS